MGGNMRKLKKRPRGVGGGVHHYLIRRTEGQGLMRITGGEKRGGVMMTVPTTQRLLEVIQEKERKRKERDIYPDGINYSQTPKIQVPIPT